MMNMKCCLEHIKQIDLDYKLLFIVFVNVLVVFGSFVEHFGISVCFVSCWLMVVVLNLFWSILFVEYVLLIIAMV